MQSNKQQLDIIWSYIKDYSNIKSSFLIKGFEECSELGNVMTFVNSLGRKHYDQFNRRQFINQNI